MTTNKQKPPDDPHDAAAHWFTREHGGLMTPDERRMFEAWRQADVRHEQAYQEMMRVWSMAKATPDAVFENILDRRPGWTSVMASRRRVLGVGAGAACCAAAAAVLMGPERWLHAPEFSERYLTRRGERRRVDLPDGSMLTLNTDSVAQVRFYRSERHVRLEQGEVFFAVASALDRPFMVDAGLAAVTVTGTAFNVRRDPDHQVSVVVESGSVEVAGGRWWNRDVRRLTARQAVQVDRSAVASEVFPADVNVAMAWRQGKVVFDATSLEAIVAEINRYRTRPIQLQSASLRQLRVAGVFSTDDPDAFLDVLPSLAPVTVLRLPDGRTMITPR
ncbi:FecR family protein [Pollutimonas sp. M17]|uniref:FecR family protein n=1 Tax=Pollutimonas sp. M17 TaxID=2962065 RepID=UPI0021F4929E|nr:FecR domain-containing protein [Pollutimonas sp. M17]UYO95024.1 FecR domain-containing protein [Pollutimonas sp. M17]